MMKKTKTATKSTATQTRHRTLATETAYVPGFPQTLFIYTLPASKYWWVRLYVSGKTIRKTTKQTDKRKALAFAKDFYDTVTYNLRHGITAGGKANFETCTQELLKEEKGKLARGELTQITYDNTKYRFDKSVLPYFRHLNVSDVDYAVLGDYLSELSKQQLSTSTVSAYMRLVRKVLSFAHRNKLIQSVPEFPSVRVKDKARGWFTTGEYRKVWNAAQRYLGKTIEVRKYKNNKGETQTQYIDKDSKKTKLGSLMRRVTMTEDLRRLIVFMTSSYIRPTDIKFMKHKHIDVIDADYKYLRLRIPPTKNHSDPITTMPYAVHVYLLHKKYHAEHGDMAKDDDYVFLPEYGEKQRDYALKQLQRQFEILMWDTGLAIGGNGEARTLYSLRHTCIMYRLMYGEGVNTLVLARNARTSVEMIDRFYAKPLSGEMNIGMLQSKRHRKRKDYDGEQGK